MNSSATLAHTGPTTLPLPLIQAQHLCFQKTAVMDLGRTARAALSGILAFVKVRSPMSTIWPRRAKLREQARLNSDASLYRGLAELAQKDYIKRQAQLHDKKNGRFHISHIRLTQKAINLLDLGDKKIIHNSPSCKMRGGHIKNVVKNNTPSLEESPDTQNYFQNHCSQKQRQQLDPQTNLPKPLVKLTKLGLAPKTICWLMRIAKQKNKRLEDVMNFAWKYLEPLASKGPGNIKAYLRKLISKEQDFAFLLKQEHDREEKRLITHTKRTMCEYVIQNQQGYYLINKNNQPIGRIEGEAVRWFAGEKTNGVERWSPIWLTDFHSIRLTNMLL